MTEFCFGKTVDYSFDEALRRIPEALKKQGFGILTEIDVKSTLKEKLGVDFTRYKILGACNPKLAHQILEAEIEAGALLPCNVIVYENNKGKTVVSVLDPETMLSFSGITGMSHVANEAKKLLSNFIKSL